MAAGSKKSTLTLTTIEQIIKYIRDNKLQRGDSLPPETEMLDIKVSRVILREAFSYLKGLGLIESKRGSSYKIAEINFANALERTLDHISFFNPDNMDDLLDLRRLMEIGSISSAVNNATAKDIEDIRAAMKKLEGFSHKKNRTIAEYEILEIEFHQAIMRPARNHILSLISTAIKNYFLASSADPNDNREEFLNIDKYHERDITEHRMISDAFALKWPDVAEQCLKKHLDHHFYSQAI